MKRATRRRRTTALPAVSRAGVQDAARPLDCPPRVAQTASERSPDRRTLSHLRARDRPARFCCAWRELLRAGAAGRAHRVRALARRGTRRLVRARRRACRSAPRARAPAGGGGVSGRCWRRPIVAHDGKALHAALRDHGLRLDRFADDTMVLAHLIDPARSYAKIADAAAQHPRSVAAG